MSGRKPKKNSSAQAVEKPSPTGASPRQPIKDKLKEDSSNPRSSNQSRSRPLSLTPAQTQNLGGATSLNTSTSTSLRADSDLQKDTQTQDIQAVSEKSQDVPTAYERGRKIARDNDLSSGVFFNKFGGGVTKQAYGVIGEPWVVLAVKLDKGAVVSKVEILKGEVRQILKIRDQGVDTPSLGPVGSVEEATFQVTVDGEAYLAFLEEKVEGHEIEKEGHAPTSEEVKAFGRGVAEDIAAAETLEQAKAKRQAAKESLEKIRRYFDNVGDIPDFQVRYEKKTGRILVLDPGSEIEGSVLAKHKEWLDWWEKEIGDGRAALAQWKKSHPDSEAKISDFPDWRKIDINK